MRSKPTPPSSAPPRCRDEIYGWSKEPKPPWAPRPRGQEPRPPVGSGRSPSTMPAGPNSRPSSIRVVDGSPGTQTAGQLVVSLRDRAHCGRSKAAARRHRAALRWAPARRRGPARQGLQGHRSQGRKRMSGSSGEGALTCRVHPCRRGPDSLLCWTDRAGRHPGARSDHPIDLQIVHPTHNRMSVRRAHHVAATDRTTAGGRVPPSGGCRRSWATWSADVATEFVFDRSPNPGAD